MIPNMTVSLASTRATLLLAFARVLFGPSRATEDPPATDVWRLAELPQGGTRSFQRDGTTLRAIGHEGFVEVRRSAWLRLIGPIEERVVMDTPAALPPTLASEV